MKLDTRHLRYLTPEDWRVLTAVEIGSKNHEIVPTSLIAQLSNLTGGGAHSSSNNATTSRTSNSNKNHSKIKNPSTSSSTSNVSGIIHKSISVLAKANLIGRIQNAKYDGYRLTYGGLDYLALHTHMKHNTLYSTGPCIGSGKESDIYICADSAGKQYVLKIHRLGRISFRSIKNNRDYLRHRSSASWMYMSRLAAQKEFLFMKTLGGENDGVRVPRAVAQNRHTVVMDLVEGVPLRAVKRVGEPAWLYANLMEIILRFAEYGLIHGDFNEFNIMIPDAAADEDVTERKQEIVGADKMEGRHGESSPPPKTDAEATAAIEPVIIDFPQMVSIDHANAAMYFDRDVNCIKTFFERRFHFLSDEQGPFFEEAKRRAASAGRKRLDVDVEASGFSRKMAKDLEKYMQEEKEGDRDQEDAFVAEPSGSDMSGSASESDHVER